MATNRLLLAACVVVLGSYASSLPHNVNHVDNSVDVVERLLSERELSKEQKVDILRLLLDLKGPSKSILSLIEENELEGLLDGTKTKSSKKAEGGNHGSVAKGNNPPKKKKESNVVKGADHNKAGAQKKHSKEPKESANEMTSKILDDALVMKSYEHVVALTEWCAGLDKLEPDMDLTANALENRALAEYIESAVEIVSRAMEENDEGGSGSGDGSGSGSGSGSGDGSDMNDGSNHEDDVEDSVDMAKISEQISKKLRQICTALNSIESNGANIESDMLKKASPIVRSHESRNIQTGTKQRKEERAEKELIKELRDDARPIEQQKKAVQKNKANAEEKTEEALVRELLASMNSN